MSIKLRFSTPDVQAICRDLRSTIMGQRISNIYDVDDKTYLFKFATPGLSEKPILLVESGIRFHTTKYSRNKNEMPSPFTMKLRKYIRSKRLDCITQLGNDRVVDLKFGSAESTHHIILELYANGNIILTDQNYEILALLRSHQFEEDIAIRVGEIYPLNFALNNTVTATQDSSGDGVDIIEPGSSSSTVFNMTVTEFVAWAKEKESLKLEMYGNISNISSSSNNNIDNQQITSAAALVTENMETDNKKGNKKDSNLKLPASTQKKQPKLTNLKQLLLSKDSGVSNLGGEIIDHCILSANLSPTLKIHELFNIVKNYPNNETISPPLTTTQCLFMNNYILLLQQLELGRTLIDKLNIPGQCGYILYKPMHGSTSSSSSGTNNENGNNSNTIASSSSSSSVTLQQEPVKTSPMTTTTTTTTTTSTSTFNQEYIEYVPLFLKQHESKAYLIFPSFDEAVDEYYYKIDDQKFIKKSNAQEESNKKKLEKMKQDQKKMLTSLVTQQNNMELNALVIEYYAEEVDKVSLVLNSAIENGMDWESIEAMVKAETNAGNPIASLIWKLKLERNHVILRLKNVLNNDDDDDDDGNSDSDDDDSSDGDNNKDGEKKKPNNRSKTSSSSSSYVDIEIDLSLSAYANARNMFSHKKTAHSKELKTIESSHRALDAVEHQIAKSLSKQKVVNSLRAVRKIHWFEKFNWFISSEGYLVLSGRDAQQNEALVKKYMRNEDIYVHANLSGAATCIVRNKTAAGVISPVALHEAATVAVCRSVAWSNKAVTSAWWVYASQVSKTAPSGEFLSTGSFMIYGKKNFLPPSTLEMGFAVMFRLEDSCVLKHVAERKDRVKLMDADELESVCSEAYDRYGIDIDTSHKDDDDNGNDEGDNHEGSGSITVNVQTKKQLRQQKLLQKQSKQQHHKVLTTVNESGEEDDEDESDDDNDDDNGGGNENSDDDNGDDDDDDSSDDSNNPDEEVKGKAVITEKQQQQQSKKAVVSSTFSSTDKKEDNSKANKGKGKGKDIATSSSSSSAAATVAIEQHQQQGKSKKKVLNKKKSRRYAEQDDEDKLLALQSLGHIIQGQLTVSEKELQQSNEKKKKNVLEKQSRVGIMNSSKKSWSEMLQVLPLTVQTKINELITTEVATIPADDLHHDSKVIDKSNHNNTSNTNKNKSKVTGVHNAKATSHSNTMTGCTSNTNKTNNSCYTLLKENELDIYEINCLLALSSDTQMLEILELFRQGVIEKNGKVGNKSGFLAGIMKRYQKDQKEKQQQQQQVEELKEVTVMKRSVNTTKKINHTATGETAEISSVEKEEGGGEDKMLSIDNMSTGKEMIKTTEGDLEDKSNEKIEGQKQEPETDEAEEQEEEQEEEDINNIVDDLDKLTGCPLPNDILLYALPVCGPFHTLQRYKYRVKLTPGTGKKGKICKQALEIFLQQSHVNNNNNGGNNITSLSSLSLFNADSALNPTSTSSSLGTNANTQQMENTLLKGLTDTEMVAIMISDTKISTPGLQTLKNKSKKAQRGAKKSNKYVNNSY